MSSTLFGGRGNWEIAPPSNTGTALRAMEGRRVGVVPPGDIVKDMSSVDACEEGVGVTVRGGVSSLLSVSGLGGGVATTTLGIERLELSEWELNEGGGEEIDDPYGLRTDRGVFGVFGASTVVPRPLRFSLDALIARRDTIRWNRFVLLFVDSRDIILGFGTEVRGSTGGPSSKKSMSS